MNINLPDTPFWLHNGNAETIFAKLLQSAPPAYRRELLPDSTGKTQIAYDFADAARPDAPHPIGKAVGIVVRADDEAGPDAAGEDRPPTG